MTLTPRRDWDCEETARAYARFARACPIHREVADGLVWHTVPPDARIVVDLDAATGAATRSILTRASNAAHVWAVERAGAMIAQARGELEDERLRWLRGTADKLVHVRGTDWVDAIVCHAAHRMGQDPSALIAPSASLLGPGGRLGLSLPAEHLGEITHLLTPQAAAFADAMAEVRRIAMSTVRVAPPQPTVPPPADPEPGQPPPASVEELESRFVEAGFARVHFELTDVIVSAAERALWYALPPVLEAWLPEVTRARRTAAARLLQQRARNLPPMRLAWQLAIGELPR